MNILVACEESQTVCKAFRAKGHNAFSCDILECSGGHPEWHIVGDCINRLDGDTTFITQAGDMHILKGRWDMIIAHPPCTYLSNAGIRWFNEKRYGEKAVQRKYKREEALAFFEEIANSKCDKICIENPVGYANSRYRKPNQTIQPYMFGDAESKRTCLWLKGLPNLKPTKIVVPKVYAYYKRGKKKGKPIYWCDYKMFGNDRAKLRSKTFQGIANAMADQWS